MLPQPGGYSAQYINPDQKFTNIIAFNLLGITHVERNGHHYVNGMADAPEAEQDAFLAAHPRLYERSHGAVRLAIRDGTLALRSLWGPGLASSVLPDWSSLSPQPATQDWRRPSSQAAASARSIPSM